MSALSLLRPFPVMSELTELKYDMWENGVSLEYFHASEDRQVTRDKVFEVIKNYLSLIKPGCSPPWGCSLSSFSVTQKTCENFNTFCDKTSNKECCKDDVNCDKPKTLRTCIVYK